MQHVHRTGKSGEKMSVPLVARGLQVGRLLVAAVLAVAMGVAPLPGFAAGRERSSTPSAAATFRLRPEAGSGRYVIYTKFALQASGQYGGRGGLFVVTRNGVSRRLTTVTHGDNNYSLSGDSLIYETIQTGAVHWWNVATGAHRQFVFHDDASIDERLGPLGAAPHGVLMGEIDSNHPHEMILEVDRLDGRLHPLAAPFPNRRFYGVTDGNGRVVVSDLNVGPHDGAVKLVSFTRPGHVRTLAGSGLGAHFCPSVTSDFVVCQVAPGSDPTNPPASMHLLGTGGRPNASTTKGCPSAFAAVLGDSAAWVVPPNEDCAAGHLWTLNINGKVSRSARVYALIAPVAAFHSVVVTTRSRHSLDELSSANAKPHVLVHVP
jgi:hypothetical protein